MVIPEKLYLFVRTVAMRLSVRRLVILCSVIVVILTILSVIGQYIYYRDPVGFRTKNVLINLFNLDGEKKIPTLFAASLIFGNGVLLLFIATVKSYRKESHVGYWFALGCIFVYLAYDEARKIHEWVLDFLMPWFGSEFIHFWVIPASIIMVAVGIAFLPFLRHLPRTTRNLFLLSAAVYLGGALGFETIGGLYAEVHRKNNLTYNLLADAEEVLEKTGMIVFGYTLLTYLQSLLREQPHEAAEAAIEPCTGDAIAPK